ncbi:helix-turn-helix transcriptional regulator [Streptomyces capparidis]
MGKTRELDPGSSALAFFGAELRRLREAQGLDQKQLGEIIYCTGSLICQIERAQKAPTLDFTQRADTALNAQGALLRLWELVSRSALPPWFRAYAELEAQAVSIATYQAQLVHGLLQTEQYARAVFNAVHTQDLEDQVAARLERQRILAREDPPVMWLILDEAILHRPIGGWEIMREQLARLLSFRHNRRVHIQILPFAAGGHAGMPGSFTVLRFDDHPDLAYTESYTHPHMTINPKEVRERTLRYDLLQAAALSIEDSADLIARVMEERYGEEHP